MKFEGLEPGTGMRLEVEVKGGLVASVEKSMPAKSEGRAPDGPSSSPGAAGSSLPYLSHGFLDMQVNGFRGLDYSSDTLDRGQIERIVESLAASGTTQHVPTIVTRPKDLILRNLRVIAEARRASPRIAAALPGIHIEGPFISSEDGPRGAHDLRYVRDPDFGEFLEWQDAADGIVKIVTVAPERSGSLDFIEKASKTGCAIAIGHSAASPETVRDAIAAGCTLSTHLGNGSHATLPRLRNYLWEQLAADELSAGIISDGFHLPAPVVKVFVRTKSLDRLVLVSDAASPGGLVPGLHRWGSLDVEVFPDGHIGLAGTPFLAGAGHLLDWDIPTFMRFSGVQLADALRLCTVNPARVLGLPRGFGALDVGTPANLAIFRADGNAKALNIERTVIAGEELYRSRE